MSDTLVGSNGMLWGTIGDSEIVVENITVNSDGEWEEYSDGDGDIVQAVAYGSKKTLSMDFAILDGSASSYLLTRGAELTLPTGENDLGVGSTFYLQTWEEKKEKNGWLSGSLTAIAYPSLS